MFQFRHPRILGPLGHFDDRFYDLEGRAGGSYNLIGCQDPAELPDERAALVEPHPRRALMVSREEGPGVACNPTAPLPYYQVQPLNRPPAGKGP